MTTEALLVSILYFIISYLDPILLSWQAVNRPIVVAPLVGLVLGDFHTGILMGASLEAIFMGISAIGGSIPADATIASVISVSYTILTGADIEAGLAIAMPIGTVMAQISAALTPIWSSFAVYWEKLAVNGTPKQFLGQNIVFSMLTTPLINSIMLFFSIAYGVDGLNNLLAQLPAWVMNGLVASSSMMIAVGLAILTSMIWDNKLGIFFFVGYILAARLGLDALSIAIIGLAIAITMFFTDKSIIDLKNSLSNINTNTSAVEGDDFFE
ncbi:PTS sugar transporter subunit IIC [Fundicoccus culcitae]|uniref:PTS sugar transporter subunit IIC n=1 Tax=Fundicoccus culcitae TaxID=2969821 RepID=A0ABY5P997_9LACT|nr:PTS sugar transporter subunit IIC [Fundicoccus culcitae]UUX35170.1 PTS sugar transporter subunit IIC [Fundicoccus culcitae]